MAMPALGSVSSGSAPEPIWLVQSATDTAIARAGRRRDGWHKAGGDRRDARPRVRVK